MTDPLVFVYQPDGERIRAADLPGLARLSDREEPIWGWLNSIDLDTGRFTRRLSHRLLGIEGRNDHLVIRVQPTPSAAGADLRRLSDECQPLAPNPYLRGETDSDGRWRWDKCSIVAWDIHLLPERDSELDRIIRAIQRGHHGHSH